MAENEEIIENNGGGEGGGQSQEKPVVTWKTESDDAQETYKTLEQVFKPSAEVVTEEAKPDEAEVVVSTEEEKPVVEIVAEEEKPTDLPIVEIDEEKVINFLKEKGIDAKSLDDLKPKEQIELDDEMKAYLKYKKETNRSYQDFLETQKDFSKEPKENVLLMNLKLENPTLNDKQIERLYKREYGYDPDYDDEDVITDKEINIERDYQKGLAKLEAQKEQYKVVRGSDELVPEEYKTAKQLVDNWNKQREENDLLFEQTKKDFQEKTDNVFNPNFEGFKVKVGEKEFKVKPENLESAKNTLSDLSNFNKKFFDETGKLKDPEGYYRALHFADNPDKIAEHFINIGKAMQAEQDEKESKNIQTVRQGSQLSSLVDVGKRFKVVEE